MLAVAALPAVALFFGIGFCPESPRWLVTKHRTEESLGILRTIRATEEKAIAELNEIQDTLAKAAQETSASFSEINQPWVRRIIYIGIGIACFTQLTGVNSIMYYGSQVLTEAGFSRQAAIIANTLNGFASVVGTLIGIHLMKTMPRRKMLTVGFCGTTSSLMLIAITAALFTGNSFFPYVVLTLTVSFLFFMQTFLGPILWLSISEIIPLRFRGFGMGCCVIFLWITNFVIGLVYPSLLANLGLQMTFVIFAAIGFISITFTRLCVPETMGKTLEEIERQFRHYNRQEIQSVGTSLKKS